MRPSLGELLASVLCGVMLLQRKACAMWKNKTVQSKLTSPPYPHPPTDPTNLCFSLHCKLCSSNNQWKRSCAMQCMSLSVFYSMYFSSINWMISLLVRLILFQHVCFSIMIYHDQISFSVADPGFFFKFQWRLHFNFHVIPTILIPYLMLSFLALLL